MTGLSAESGGLEQAHEGVTEPLSGIVLPNAFNDFRHCEDLHRVAFCYRLLLCHGRGEPDLVEDIEH